MAHDGPSSLPSFYGEKTPEGRVVKRPSDEEELLASPNMTSKEKAPDNGRDGGFEPPSGANRARWSLDDTRREEYWKGYWDRKRMEKERERESHWYPEYRGPMRYIEYPDEDPSPRAVFRQSSRRESRPPPPPGHSSRAMRRSFDGDLPPKRPVETGYDDEYVEMIYPEGGGRRRGPSMPPHRPSMDESSTEMRLPFLSWMGNTIKGHFVAALGEFVGTTMFLFFAFAGTQVANVGGRNNQSSTTGSETGFSPEVLLYISLVFGFSLMVNVWVFFRISGGLFNPAVTLAMFMTRSITAFRALLLVGVQLAGSIFASFLVKVLFPTEFKVRTTLSTGTSLVRGVFIEAVLTFELVFTIFLLAKEKHKATFIAPVGIGLALFIAELVGVFYTGGSLNPARSFGPCVVTGIFDQEHWIYWVGPGTGAIAAVLFYKFIKILEYEMANPGQDEASAEDAAVAAKEVAHGNKPSHMTV